MSAAENPFNEALMIKVANAITLGDGALYNRRSFLRITASASPGLVSELFEIMDERELAVTLNEFIYKKPKDA
jgi:hypothetical protein